MVRSDATEERMPESLGHADPVRGVVDQHLLDEVEQQLVVLSFGHAIFVQRLAVLPHVLPGRAGLVPHELAAIEVLRA